MQKCFQPLFLMQHCKPGTFEPLLTLRTMMSGLQIRAHSQPRCRRVILAPPQVLAITPIHPLSNLGHDLIQMLLGPQGP